MQTGTSQVRVYQQNAVIILGEHCSQVHDRCGLTFSRAAADDRDRIHVFILAAEQNVSTQDTVGFRVGRVGIVFQVSHILRDDADHAGTQCLFHFVDRLEGSIQIFHKESKTDTADQTHDHTQDHVQNHVGFDRLDARFRDICDLYDRRTGNIFVDIFHHQT